MELNPATPMPYGWKREDLIKCAQREVAMRKSCYPGWIAKKRMTKLEAERELGMMMQIADAVNLAELFDHADLTVAAVFIELRKYACFEKLLNEGFPQSELTTIQNNIANHIRQNIYNVSEVQAQLGIESEDPEDEDVGL